MFADKNHCRLYFFWVLAETLANVQHGACMGTLGLMECQMYVLHVVRILEKNREKCVICRL